MGSASKIASVCLRAIALICAAVVAGIEGHYLYLVNKAGDTANGRIIYVEVIAGLSIALALILITPWKYSFWAFPIDFAMFICWIVAFGLLMDLGGCHSHWYWTSWGYYWGGWYRTVSITDANETLIGTVNCSTFRAGNAFAFIGGWFWLGSGFCGLYVVTRDHGSAKKTPEMSTNGVQAASA